MAYQISYDAGMGGIPVASVDRSSVSVYAGYAITGIYSMRCDRGWIKFRFVTPTSSPAVSFWLVVDGDGYEASISFYLTDGTRFYLSWNTTTRTFDLRNNAGALVASGTAGGIAQGTLFNVRVYGTVGDSSDLYVLINGVESIHYTGDLQPGASADVSYLYFYTGGGLGGSRRVYISSLSLNDGGADPGDRRVCVRMVDGDNTVQWAPSTGATNYGVVDEAPYSDTDYVEADTNGEKDLMTLQDLAENVYAIAGVTKFARAWKTTAGSEELKNGIKAGSTEDTTQHALSATAEYYLHPMGVNPDDSAAWEDADIDALLALQEAVL